MDEPNDEPSRDATPRDAPQVQGPAGLVIRASEPTDAEAFAAMVNLPGFRAGTNQLPFRTVGSCRTELERDEPGRVHVVAVLEGAIVGAAGLTRLAGRRAHVAGLGMGVHDDHVGRGIGTALLGALLDVADNWLALSRVELTVHVDNHPAIHLYERAGFEHEGLYRRFAVRGGVFVDALAMARLRS